MQIQINSKKRTSISRDTKCILFEMPVNGVVANPNIYKWKLLESMILVLDKKSNMMSKYGANFFIIVRWYKWEVCEIDTDRHDAGPFLHFPRTNMF